MLKKHRGNARGWKEFGSWMANDVMKGVNDIPDAVVYRMKNLVAGETTNEQKARKIYQYLQDRVRYVSVQIGIGGWRPMPASEVDRLAYGDCKALTNYMKALLDAVGIPSYYTIVYSGARSRDIMEDLVSFQGNHIILGIPDGEKITWLECTSQDLPYGFLGRATADRNVLLLTEEGGEIVRTPAYQSTQNLQKTTAVVTVDATGHISAAVNRVSQGLQYEGKLRLTTFNEKEIEEYYKNNWNQINGFSISETNFENNRDEVVFKESIVLETSQYTTKVSQGFLLAPDMFNHDLYIPPQVANREFPLSINTGFVDEDTVDIVIPDGFRVETLLDPVRIETVFGYYQTNVEKVEPNLIRYTRTFQLKKGNYPASEYENYRQFIRSVVQEDLKQFLIKTNG